MSMRRIVPWKSSLLVLVMVAGAGLISSLMQHGGVDSAESHQNELLLSVAESRASDYPGPSGPIREDTPEGSVGPDVSGSSEPAGGLERSGSKTDDSDTADAELRKRIVGAWQQRFYGTRLLTVLPDGTATMVIRPDSVWAFAFGEQITLDMFWKIRKGRIDYGIRSGSPPDKVEIARKTWGDRWDEQILELTDDRLVLLAEDGKTQSVWTRAATIEESTPTVSPAAPAPPR